MAQSISPASYSSVVNGAEVDMQGWDGCLFLLNIGLIAATGVLNALVQSDAATGMGSPTTVAGSEIAALGASDDDILVVVDVHGEIPERFLRMAVTPSVAASLLGVVAIRYRGRRAPAVNAGLEERVDVAL
jgi:hypothetical protein